MKLARNLVIALAVLVLLYGGVYWLAFKDRIRSSLGWGEFVGPGPGKPWRKFFALAGEIDSRLTVDQPERKRLRGRWINADTGDFVTIPGNDACTFQLGRFRHSGNADFDRRSLVYTVEFQDGGVPRFLMFSGDEPFNSGNPHRIATAYIGHIGVLNQTLSDPDYYETELTRAPSPAP